MRKVVAAGSGLPMPRSRATFGGELPEGGLMRGLLTIVLGIALSGCGSADKEPSSDDANRTSSQPDGLETLGEARTQLSGAECMRRWRNAAVQQCTNAIISLDTDDFSDPEFERNVVKLQEVCPAADPLNPGRVAATIVTQQYRSRGLGDSDAVNWCAAHVDEVGKRQGKYPATMISAPMPNQPITQGEVAQDAANSAIDQKKVTLAQQAEYGFKSFEAVVRTSLTTTCQAGLDYTLKIRDGKADFYMFGKIASRGISIPQPDITYETAGFDDASVHNGVIYVRVPVARYRLPIVSASYPNMKEVIVAFPERSGDNWITGKPHWLPSMNGAPQFECKATST